MIGGFVIAALLLLCFVLFLIFWPVIHQSSNEIKTDYVRNNLSIFKQRLKELEQEKSQGNLDEQSFQHLKVELEKSFLLDVENAPQGSKTKISRNKKHWYLASGLSLIVLLSAISLYLKFGRSDDYIRSIVLAEQDKGVQKQSSNLRSMVDQLRAKLVGKPEELPKWYLLAKSYLSMGDYSKAVEVFRKILDFTPKSHPDYAAILGQYGQSLFMASNETVTPEVNEIAESALTIDKAETSALTLKGIQAYDQQNFQEAINYWNSAKIKAAPEQIENFLQPAINSASEKLGITVTDSNNAMPLQSVAASLPVTLSLDPNLASKVTQDSFVFVFAREPGGRMPLAAVKLRVADLPKTVTLDDAKAVMPTNKLSMVPVVNVTARISSSGQAIEQPGDLYGMVEQVKVEQRKTPINLIINSQVK